VLLITDREPSLLDVVIGVGEPLSFQGLVMSAGCADLAMNPLRRLKELFSDYKNEKGPLKGAL
jgi:hypothetical protein